MGNSCSASAGDPAQLHPQQSRRQAAAAAAAKRAPTATPPQSPPRDSNASPPCDISPGSQSISIGQAAGSAAYSLPWTTTGNPFASPPSPAVASSDAPKRSIIMLSPGRSASAVSPADTADTAGPPPPGGSDVRRAKPETPSTDIEVQPFRPSHQLPLPSVACAFATSPSAHRSPSASTSSRAGATRTPSQGRRLTSSGRSYFTASSFFSGSGSGGSSLRASTKPSRHPGGSSNLAAAAELDDDDDGAVEALPPASAGFDRLMPDHALM